MDWSSVYEDEGEETGDWEREEDEGPSSRAGLIAAFGSDGKYTPFICYAFTVNYILGVGCLGIPYAFLQSGIVLGTCLVLFLSFISYVTVIWVAVATQQEVSISIYHAATHPFVLSPYSSLAKRKKYVKHQIAAASHERTSLVKKSRSSLGQYYASIANLLEKQPSDKLLTAIEKEMEESSSKRRAQQLDRRKSALSDDELISGIKELEVTDLAQEFLGPWGKLSYQCTLMALTYVGLLAYTQVFNDTFLKQVWPSAPRYLPPALFGLIVVPLSCLDLSEQIHTQVIMSLLRFVALGVLLIGTLVALAVDFENSALKADYWPDPSLTVSEERNVPLLQWSGFGVMFTTAIFSQLFQHSVPGLIRPLSNDDKKYVPSIFRNALLTTACLYISTGCCTVFYFGRHLAQSVNLNFVDFHWGLHGGRTMQAVTGLLAMIVVLFPALDTLSVFPLIAITLGNNLHAAFPTLDPFLLQNKPEKHVSKQEKQRLRRLSRTFWRLIAAVPPVLGSLLISDLVTSLQIAGICGIFVALIVPALLHEQTEHRIALIPASMQTSLLFPDSFNRSIYVVVVVLLGLCAMAICILQMIQR